LRGASRGLAAAVVALAVLVAAPLADAKPHDESKKAVPVKVMTRNLFLGADLGPALNATGFESFIEANGAILREVDHTNFPLRAQGLAAEIASKKPDLVGLQEAALWRTGPVQLPPAVTGGAFGATTVKYDFVQNLLDELSKRGQTYTVAVSGDEFDFEAPADYNDVDNDAPAGIFNADPTTNDEAPGSLDDAEMNGRLTMRDVILVRKGGAVKTSNPQSGHYQHLFTPVISGITIPVTRGWVSVDAKAKKGKGKNQRTVKFHFVNSHFEAFDDETQHPSIRALQAQELLAGPASAKRSIILGDFNSDVPGVKPGDEQAYQTLLDGGFAERSLDAPTTCCFNDLFAPTNTLDHQVDHVMTNMGKKVKLANSSATGTTQANGIYDSDHAGVFSKLIVKR
jgi:hypothetical protein